MKTDQDDLRVSVATPDTPDHLEAMQAALENLLLLDLVQVCKSKSMYAGTEACGKSKNE